MSHLWAHSPDTVVFFWLCVYLSEYVAGKGLIEPRLHVYKLKKVQTISVFLHHHLKVTPILKHLQHLVTPTQVYDVKQHSSRLKTHYFGNFCDRVMWCKPHGDLNDVMVRHSGQYGDLLAHSP